MILWGWANAAALAIAMGLLVSAHAQDRNASSAPRMEAATAASAARNCVTADAGFQHDGKKPHYVVALTNACDDRIRCKVNAYVTTAFGPSSGRTTLTLAPKSKNSAAKRSFVLNVRQSAGSANYTVDCWKA